MSWGLDIELDRGGPAYVELFDGHTYNLSPMWRLAGVFNGASSELEGLRATELADRAARGLLRAVTRPAEFRALNPSNGWGDFDGFVEILTHTAIVCAEHREGTIRWNG